MVMDDALRKLEGAATIALAAVVIAHGLDTLSRGELSRRARRFLERARDAAAPPVPVPSPRDVSAVLSEASRYTREAAENG